MTTENNKKKDIMIALVMTLGVMIVILIIAILVLSNFKQELKIGLTELNCCDGNTCTDTYYTPEDNTCHLVLCENSFGDNCTYEGKNDVMDAINSNERAD